MNKAFVPFITAGDPSLEKTREFIDVLAPYSDIIEVGLPFSDPIAEGEVIQSANLRALQQAVTTDQVFAMLQTVDFEKMVILAYANSLFAYGYERFFARCRESGVYGVIVPDLPFEEREEAAQYARARGVHLITLIAPTSAARVQMLAKGATGFIYLVSSMGVTGVRNENSSYAANLPEIVAQIRAVTDTPVLIGFGISNKETADNMRKIADGVIVGSALVRIIEEHGENSAPYLEKFAKQIR